MDAMLEFTSAGHVPQILRDNAARSVKPQDILPQRMEKNKLHRYSKVFKNIHFQWRFITLIPMIKILNFTENNKSMIYNLGARVKYWRCLQHKASPSLYKGIIPINFYFLIYNQCSLRS